MASVPHAREGDAGTGEGGADDGAAPVVALRGAALSYGARTVWRDLELEVRPGEFVAVLGPNGSGKTSLVRALLGQWDLSAGTLTVLGRPPREVSRQIGYVPQQAALSTQAPLRARELVRFGIDGHRFGPARRTRAVRRRVDEILREVGALSYADVPLGLLSGGERQRVRIGQALATDPRILLCDEPLLSLDLHHQRAVTELIDARRRAHDTAVVFVTHEINPVLGLVDRVLYLAPGGHRVGTPDEVLTSEALSRLYGTRVEVVRVHGRVVVVGAPDSPGAPEGTPHHPQELHERDGVRP